MSDIFFVTTHHDITIHSANVLGGRTNDSGDDSGDGDGDGDGRTTRGGIRE